MYVRMTYIAQNNEIPWICPEFHVCHIMLPSGRGDHLTIPQVNLSILGYEPNLQRTQEISIIPQLDGPGSLPIRDPIGRRMQEIPRSIE